MLYNACRSDAYISQNLIYYEIKLLTLRFMKIQTNNLSSTLSLKVIHYVKRIEIL
jgi:hypothetical protein